MIAGIRCNSLQQLVSQLAQVYDKTQSYTSVKWNTAKSLCVVSDLLCVCTTLKLEFHMGRSQVEKGGGGGKLLEC